MQGKWFYNDPWGKFPNGKTNFGEETTKGKLNYQDACIIIVLPLSFQVSHGFLWIKPICFAVLLLGKLYDYLVTQLHTGADLHWLSQFHQCHAEQRVLGKAITFSLAEATQKWVLFDLFFTQVHKIFVCHDKTTTSSKTSSLRQIRLQQYLQVSLTLMHYYLSWLFIESFQKNFKPQIPRHILMFSVPWTLP